MKVFVTGAEGFVGKRLVARLKEKGMEVTAVDIIATPGSSTVSTDIRSRKIKDFVPQGADAIVHLAGFTRTPDCKNKGYLSFETNVMATLNLIDAAEERQVKQFIFASSETVYGEWTDASLVKDEESPDNVYEMTSEYAFSKLVSEVNLKQKYQYGFCPVTILRLGVVYGLREKNWSAVESIFNDVKTREEVKVGSLKTGRCFIHVEDIVSGIIASFGLKGFNVINLHGDDFITLGEIIETSRKILGKNPRISEKGQDNLNLRRVSNNRAKSLLKWKPSFNLDRGLRSLL